MKKFKTIRSVKHSRLNYDIDAHSENLIIEVYDSFGNQPDCVAIPFEVAYELIASYIPDDILFQLDYQAGNVSSVVQTELADVFIQIADEQIIDKHINIFRSILSVSVLDKEEFLQLSYRKQFAHYLAVHNEVSEHNWKKWFSDLVLFIQGRTTKIDKNLSIIASNLKWYVEESIKSWEKHFIDIYYDHDECSIHYAQTFHEEMQVLKNVYPTELCEFLNIRTKVDEDEIYYEMIKGVFVPIENIEFTHLELIKYLYTNKLQQA